MVARRPSLLAAGAAACAAIALWVSFGVLSFVDAENHAPYVGVLPSLQWLGLQAVYGPCRFSIDSPRTAMCSASL